MIVENNDRVDTNASTIEDRNMLEKNSPQKVIGEEDAGRIKHCLMRSGLWADNGLSAVHRHATMSNQHIHMHADIPNTKY